MLTTVVAATARTASSTRAPALTRAIAAVATSCGATPASVHPQPALQLRASSFSSSSSSVPSASSCVFLSSRAPLHIRPPVPFLQSCLSQLRGSLAVTAASRPMSTATPPPCQPASEALRYGDYKHASTPAREGGDVPPGLTDNVWRQQLQTPLYPPLTRDEGEVDVVVVGAGIAGLNIAYDLAKHGKCVAVVEGRTRGSGQTGRTSAHLMQWHDDFYSVLEGKFGRDNTKLIAQSMMDAIAFIEGVVQAEGIDCDFTRLDGYLFPPECTPSALKELDEEWEACKRAGLSDVRKVDLGGDSRFGGVTTALLFPRSAEFHPLKYVNGLAKVLTEKYGVKMFEKSRVLTKDLGADGRVPAVSGGRVRAREAVVLATNSPINRNVAVHARQEAWRTYMVGLALPKGSVARANWWTTEEIYHYIRIQPEEGRDVLLVGGQDHPAGQAPASYRDCWAELEAFARTRWPQAGEVVYRWSGQVYEPVDQLGMYGLDPLHPVNAPTAAGVPTPALVPRYIATGDSGQGITGSAQAAMVIGGVIRGAPSPYADLYSTTRLKTLLAPSSLQALGEEVVETVRGFMRAAPRDAGDIKGVVLPDSVGADLKPGEGRVSQEGVWKVALYRDHDNTLHRHSAACTHLGCMVEWNPNDATFDCCCHGSQFDRYGRVINGPACVDLEDLGVKKV